MLGADLLFTPATKQYLLIKEEINVARTIRKPKRQECGFGIHAFYSDRDIRDK